METNKQWLINEIEIMGSETSESYPHEQMVDRELVIKLVEELDEPEKVVIPQFVADWISQAKKWEYSISDSMGHVGSYFDTTQYDKAVYWAKKNQDIFARAWLDGYEVEKEKEKLYYVELIKDSRYVVQASDGSIWFSYTVQKERLHGDKVMFTQREIAAIDPRFWAFALEVAE